MFSNDFDKFFCICGILVVYGKIMDVVCFVEVYEFVVLVFDFDDGFDVG